MDRLHDPVLDQHRVAVGALAEAAAPQIELHAERAREIAAAIGQHQHLLADILRLAPGAHDKSVVDRDAGDLIDALRLQIRRLLDIARQVTLRASRGEGARHREQRHLLAAKQLVGGDVLRAFRAQIFERRRGNLVANLDRHGGCLRFGLRELICATGRVAPDHGPDHGNGGRTDSTAARRRQTAGGTATHAAVFPRSAPANAPFSRN